MGKVFRILGELILPPKCLCCGKRLAPSLGERPSPRLCRSCEGEWERSKLAQCPICFAAYCDCRCQPHTMKRAGSTSFVKLAPYGTDREMLTVSRLVRYLKRVGGFRGFSFCAAELKPLLEAELATAEEKEEISRTVMVHLPRSPRNINRLGFDQAKRLARALSREMGLEHMTALKRIRDGSEQKTLTLRERHANIKGAFALKASVKGARVILVDDVVTTGAGMAEAVRVLKRGGAAEILSVAVAYTKKVK